MDRKIVDLYKNGKFKDISSVLKNMSSDSLIEFADDHVLRQKYTDNPTTILRALFSGIRDYYISYSKVKRRYIVRMHLQIYTCTL